MCKNTYGFEQNYDLWFPTKLRLILIIKNLGDAKTLK